MNYFPTASLKYLNYLHPENPFSDIATQMLLSVTTVSTYRARVLAKMNLKTNADLTIYAIESKLMNA